jgi:uncharacterized protein YraI
MTTFVTRRVSAFVVSAALAAAGAIMPGAAQAQQPYQAFAAEDAVILSGPSPDYPPVASLRQGDPVYVYGCLEGYSWCDVAAGPYRGWFDASQLDYQDQGQVVPFYEYAYGFGLPIVSFSLYDYWGRWYHDRPFFYERDRFARIPLPAPRHFDHDREFYHDPGHFDHRPDFHPHPVFEGRPAFQGPAHPGFEAGRPAFEGSRPEQHGQPEPQRPQGGPMPQVQHMQGPPSHERYVGQGQPPQQHPQGGPARPAGEPHPQQPQGQPHPQGGQGQPHPKPPEHPEPPHQP